MPIIAPSLLSANFLQLEEECKMIERSEADWLHLDVMDGRFVPNISFGLPVIQQLRTITNMFFDVHLMIVEPEKYIEAFHKAGANGLTIHYETCPHLHRNIQQIKSLGMKAGVALNPHTPVECLKNVLEYIDLVLIMSVNPGFGGQHFIPQTLVKIKQLHQMIQEYGYATVIEVDGGITLENASSIVAAGAQVLVAGNTIFHSQHPLQTIAHLKQIT
jgi:ribulose-phosphate 3-epimerase